MADFAASPRTGGVGSQAGMGAGRYVNVAAAAVSIALIGGVGVWGYKLLMRDVTGVPVVRAMEGDMRVAPTNPGGEIAAHLGLSVNTVPADGGAGLCWVSTGGEGVPERLNCRVKAAFGQPVDVIAVG